MLSYILLRVLNKARRKGKIGEQTQSDREISKDSRISHDNI